MINILIGAPGGGKSYEAVAYHVLPAVQAGRKVITNLPLNVDYFEAIVPGSTRLIEIREKTKAKKPEPDVRMVYGRMVDINNSENWKDRPFAHVEDFQDEWRDENGRGPFYVIDECHFCLPYGATETAVEEWFSMHRHYNVDVLLITQSYGKCSRSIIDLVQVCYKVRKAVAFGKTDGYVRKVLDGVRGAEISVQQRKYDKKFFNLYKSHTHGTALTEKDPDDVSPLIVKYRLFTKIFWAVTIIVLIWAFWPSSKKKTEEKKDVSLPVEMEKQKHLKPSKTMEIVNSGSYSETVPSDVDLSKTVFIPEKPKEIVPLENDMIHVTGYMQVGKKETITFAVSEGGARIFELTSNDLKKMGYNVRMLSKCVVILEINGKSRQILCNAPYLQPGTRDRPVVVDSTTGRRSDEASVPVSYQ